MLTPLKKNCSQLKNALLTTQVAVCRRGMAEWHNSSMAQREYGNIVVQQLGTMAQWQYGSTAVWQYSSIAQWHNGNMGVQQYGTITW